MKPLSCLLAGIVWTSALVATLPAQPVLNRVEQFLRDQVGAVQDLTAPPAAQPGQPAQAERGYLGLVADDRQDLGRGVRITSVTPGGPASQGGLLTGDLITAIDGLPIRVMDDVGQALSGKTPGTKVQVTVNRVGAERQLEVTLGRRPESRVVGPVGELPPPPADGDTAAPVAAPRPRLGVRTLPVSDEVRLFNNLPDARGATVIAVTPGSPAEQAGIPLGAVVTAVNDQVVETPQGLASAIAQAGNEVELTFIDHGIRAQKRITLGQAGLASDAPKLELRARPVEPPARPMPTDEPTLAVPAQTAEPATPDNPPIAEEPAAESSAHVTELEARVRELEARIEKLEAALTQQKSDAK